MQLPSGLVALTNQEVSVKPQITVIGLGPGNSGLLTRESWSVLNSSSEIYLRTSEHPAVPEFPQGLIIHSFDSLYEGADDFDEIYTEIVERVVEEAKSKGSVVYAVPGDPFVGEATVLGLRIQAEENDIEFIVKSGVSFIEPSLHLLGIDALDGVQIADSLELASTHHPSLSPDQPALIAQLYSRLVAADVKLTLLNQYPEEHPVKLIHAAGTKGAIVESLHLFEIDRSEKYGSYSSLFVPPLEMSSAFESFQETVAHLRAPDGCPWDREQTHESLRMHLMEECYEALDAIDRGDLEALKEELGDLTLQIVLQTQIATEAGDFRMVDVLAAINDKIIRRHPHVFEGLELDGVPEVLHNWEALKAEEREEEGADKGLMEGVPIGLPALSQANELQGRAARVGFDWREESGVIKKVEEELSEVLNAETDLERESELGDLLFAIVNYARWINVDPESALRQANSRFRDRFGHIERWAKSKDRKLSDMTLEEMDALWEDAKGQ
jgi:tetrapyrrole methylase family protein/MazG family protein